MIFSTVSNGRVNSYFIHQHSQCTGSSQTCLYNDFHSLFLEKNTSWFLHFCYLLAQNTQQVFRSICISLLLFRPRLSYVKLRTRVSEIGLPPKGKTQVSIKETIKSNYCTNYNLQHIFKYCTVFVLTRQPILLILGTLTDILNRMTNFILSQVLRFIFCLKHPYVASLQVDNTLFIFPTEKCLTQTYKGKEENFSEQRQQKLMTTC